MTRTISAGFAALVMSVASHASSAQEITKGAAKALLIAHPAVVVQAPEISTSGMVSGLMLLIGAACVLQGRRRARS